MGKGGKVDSKRNSKNRVRSKNEGSGSDDSDEDYVAEVDEIVSDDDLEDLGNSLDEYASEESFGSYVEEEEDGEFRKVIRSNSRKGSRANGKIGGKTSRKRKRVSYEQEEEEDEDYVNDDDDDDDDEFSPEVNDDDEDDDDFLDEDEELTTKKKTTNMKVRNRSIQRRGTERGVKKRRKSRVSNKPLTKKRKTRRLKKKERCEIDDEYEGDFIDDTPDAREKSSKNSVVRRKYAVSDSEFIPSGSSDYEYTISEEEREQVREASKMYRGVKTSLRSSSSVKNMQEDGDLYQEGKSVARKGKEKVKEVKAEVGKQVCGICLSEEDKRRLKGTLDCCSHYFCFTCIMEWSKVESRCPLCKQRFKSITKNGRAALGVESKTAVIQVPKRDQVYQPTEEEIRSFIDPYENVICTECHEGGEDGLMLLCDLCDSPAHTFCVGLGHQVPEGNWYCDGCRPIALGSTSSQDLDPMAAHQRTTNNIFSRPSTNANTINGLDSTLEPSPRRVFAHGFGNLSSPRFPGGDVQLSSPIPGAGAATLTHRRQLHRHIQNLMTMNRVNHMGNRTEVVSDANLRTVVSNPHNDQFREATVQISRTQETRAPQGTFIDERWVTHDHPSSSLQNGDLFSSRLSQIRMQALQDQSVSTTDRSVNLTLWPELSAIAPISGHDQFQHHNSRQGLSSEVNMPPRSAREENQFYVVKEQLQSMVKSHLKSLSQNTELGPETAKDILRSSTHTILAACGLEHKRSEVHSIPPPSICMHGDRLIAGQTSILKGFCSSCFDSFVRDVVKTIMDTRLPQWLSLGL